MTLKIDGAPNDVVFYLVHCAMRGTTPVACNCGNHSDETEEHAPHCEWRKQVSLSANHAGLIVKTRERGPLLEHNDQGDVMTRFRLPPGHQIVSASEYEEFRKSKALQLAQDHGAAPASAPGQSGKPELVK